MNTNPQRKPSKQEADEAGYRKLQQWMRDPVQFVREAFDVEPDAWQIRALKSYNVNRRLAMQACKGVGKTTVLSWCIWHFLLRMDAQVIALAQSGGQLKTGLWKELAYWRNKCELLMQTFEMGDTKIRGRGRETTWFCHSRTWSKTEDEKVAGQGLQGLHGAFSMFVLDESGGMPDAIGVAADAILSELKTQGGRSVIVQAGNPTMLTGPLYRAATTERDMWDVIEITGDPDDPERSSRMDPVWAREQIKKYGKDDPWVLVNVFGKFPPQSFNALIGRDEVLAACGRHLAESQYAFAPKTIGADVARYGDDACVMWPRQGLAAFIPEVMRNMDSITGANKLVAMADEWGTEVHLMVDATGGFGSGWVDAIRHMNRECFEVLFSAKPTQEKYFNKRTEMYFELVKWIKSGGALPPVGDEKSSPVGKLIEDLTKTLYTFKGDKLILEDKEQIKERLGRSPDYADALACTFAFKVTSQAITTIMSAADARGDFTKAKTEYDPLERA